MLKTQPQRILEVIACSVTDAVEAEKGGADRLEVITSFDRDGFTPPIELVRQIIDSVSLPLRVMVRETEEFTVTDAAIIERLCDAAQAFSRLPMDGLVLGFVRNSGIDVELTRRILSHAPNLKATFHHAFEKVENPFDAIDQLKDISQIDRILTMGGREDWAQKIKMMEDYQRAAAPGIAVLAGGGLDRNVIKKICTSTDIREFHVGRAVRSPATADGAVQSSLVKELVKLIKF